MKASEIKGFDVVKTGFANLDKLTGLGGLPMKKLTEISGKWSVGKTTLAHSIIAEAQKAKHPTLWIDTEYGYDVAYSESLGVNNKELDLIQERFAEDVLDQTEEWIEKNKNGFVVLDSIGGLLPRAEAEKSADGKIIGGQAKLIATFCRKIIPLLSINNVGLVVLNHEFIDLMSGALKTSGGAKLEYHKSLWIRLRRVNKRIMQGDKQLGVVVQAEIRKNKLSGTEKQSTELELYFGDGFNPSADILQNALDTNIIEKKGNTYYLNDEKLCIGMPKLRDMMKDEAFAANIKELTK